MPANAALRNPDLTDNEVVSIITDKTRWSILKCLNAPKSASQIAKELDLKPANVQYHAKVLIDAGILDEFQHPDYACRFLYSRRTMKASLSIGVRGMTAHIEIS